MYVPTNIRQFASTRETSDAIALAIFEIANEGDEARLWTSPSAAEEANVLERAWTLADAETDVLHWGNQRFARED